VAPHASSRAQNAKAIKNKRSGSGKSLDRGIRNQPHIISKLDTFQHSDELFLSQQGTAQKIDQYLKRRTPSLAARDSHSAMLPKSRPFGQSDVADS
jgi:hypothetical protein